MKIVGGGTTLRAAVLHGPGDVRIDSVDDPPEPAPDEAVVAPLWCGLCGTDVKEYVGRGGSVAAKPHPMTGAHIPLPLGHEFSARVVAVGSALGAAGPGGAWSRVTAGDEVAIMPLQYCGRCPACRRGEFVRCRVKAWSGLSSPWGGLSDLALVKGYQLTPLDGISPIAGALIEPAAVALNAVLRANVRPGDAVFVAGVGAIGAFAIMSALAAGAALVVAAEPNPRRAELARSLGARVAPADAADLPEFVHALTGGEGMDISLECAGRPGALKACVDVTRPGAVVGVPAVHPGEVATDIRRLTRDDITMFGSVGYSQDAWARTVRLVRSGGLAVEKALTARIDRDELVDAGFDRLADPETDQLKILVRVNG
jgi:(R,R)-butanediol dehydrogenase/meso-butanediol dehydrogenase/diacetyl reductase